MFLSVTEVRGVSRRIITGSRGRNCSRGGRVDISQQAPGSRQWHVDDQTRLKEQVKIRANITGIAIVCLCSALFLRQAYTCLQTYLEGETIINLENIR